MIHLVEFHDGTADYRNRFVRTDGFLAEQDAGESLWAGILEMPGSARRDDGWGARTRMKDASSTDIVVHRGMALSSFYSAATSTGSTRSPPTPRGKEDGGSPSGASRRTRRWTASPANCCSSATARRSRTCATASSTRTATCVHYHRRPAARPAPAARHGLHRELRDPQRLPAVLGPELLEQGVHAPGFAPRPADRASRSSRAAATTEEIRWFETDPTYVLHFDQRLRGRRRDRPRRLLPGRPAAVDQAARSRWRTPSTGSSRSTRSSPGCTAGAST